MSSLTPNDGSVPYESLVRKDFSGKTAIVLGGSSGIGLEIVHALYEQGAKVHVLGLTPVPAEVRHEGTTAIHSYVAQQTKAEKRNMPNVAGPYPRYTPEFVECNIMQRDEDNETLVVQNEVERIGKLNGGINYLVSSIGWSPRKPLDQLPLDEMTNVRAVNTDYIPYVFQTAAPFMATTKDPRIVVIGSTKPHGNADEDSVAYAAAKGALAAIVTNLSKLYGEKYGIGISLVSPGFVATENEAKILKDFDKTKAQALAKRPIAVDLTPRDVANQVLLQLTPHAAHLSGSETLLGASFGKHLLTRENVIREGASPLVAAQFPQAALEILARIEQSVGPGALEMARRLGELEAEVNLLRTDKAGLLAVIRGGSIPGVEILTAHDHANDNPEHPTREHGNDRVFVVRQTPEPRQT